MSDASQSEPTSERLGGLFDDRDEWAPLSSGGRVAALTGGMVVVDTNVLLHLYRFGPEARDELMDVLAVLGSRLIVPAQVADEFRKSRFGTAMDARKELQDAAKQVTDSFKTLGTHLRSIGLNRGLSQREQEIFTVALAEAEEKITAMLDASAQERAKIRHPSDPDPLMLRIQELLDGKVGMPYPTEREEELRKEAQRRKEAKIPPGWKDSDPAGDYLVWCQLLDEARRRSLPVLPVTDDVKEDWALSVRGYHVGLQPALIREAHQRAGVDVYLSDVADFLFVARDELKASVSTETIDEARQEVDRPRRRMWPTLKIDRLLLNDALAGATTSNAALVRQQNPDLTALAEYIRDHPVESRWDEILRNFSEALQANQVVNRAVETPSLFDDPSEDDLPAANDANDLGDEDPED